MKRMLLILAVIAVILCACNASGDTASESADRITPSEAVDAASDDGSSGVEDDVVSDSLSDGEGSDGEGSDGDGNDASTVYAVYIDDCRGIPAGHEDLVAKILRSDGWVDATAECLNNFTIKLDGVEYLYHSECGTINVFGEERSKRLNDADKLTLDLILAGVFEAYRDALSDAGIFPEDAVYGDGIITVDLNRDGNAETLRQSFSTERNVWERGDLHYYTLEATVDGNAVTVFERCEWIPMQESDFCVFIVDVNADDVFEVAVLACGGIAKDSLSVYSVGTDGAALLQLYTLA